jgi:DNA-binding MarR family transcriptional regulator
MRLTYRTLRVPAAIAEQPGACNREVAEAAEVSDQGQISRLLARLQDLGLIHSSGKRRLGEPHEWHLTTRGKQLERVARAGPKRPAR